MVCHTKNCSDGGNKKKMGGSDEEKFEVRHSRDGGALVDDLQHLAVPFAILLAKQGLDKFFTGPTKSSSKKEKPAKKEKEATPAAPKKVAKKTKGGDCGCSGAVRAAGGMSDVVPPTTAGVGGRAIKKKNGGMAEVDPVVFGGRGSVFKPRRTSGGMSDVVPPTTAGVGGRAIKKKTGGKDLKKLTDSIDQFLRNY